MKSLSEEMKDLVGTDPFSVDLDRELDNCCREVHHLKYGYFWIETDEIEGSLDQLLAESNFLEG